MPRFCVVTLTLQSLLLGSVVGLLLPQTRLLLFQPGTFFSLGEFLGSFTILNFCTGRLALFSLCLPLLLDAPLARGRLGPHRLSVANGFGLCRKPRHL